MRNYTRLTLVMMSSLPVLALAQNADREMTCDDQWQSDRVSHCEINEMTIPATSRLSVDGGVNGGMTVKSWPRNEVLVRARVQTAAESAGKASYHPHWRRPDHCRRTVTRTSRELVCELRDFGPAKYRSGSSRP